MSTSAIFMSYEGVEGEATAVSHISSAPAGGAWIELLGCDYGGSAAYAQRTSAQSEMQTDIRIGVTKQTDAATIGLLRQAMTGDFKKNIVISFVRQGVGEPTEYQRLELANGGIVAFSISGGPDRPLESYRLYFGQLTITSWAFEGTERRAPAVTVIMNEV